MPPISLPASDDALSSAPASLLAHDWGATWRENE